jgi:uncharacterized protein (DUF427 family)
MSLRMREVVAGGLEELRHEPTARRIRAELGGGTVVDSTAAVLVWEPRRIVPSYAVPVADVRATLVPAAPQESDVPGGVSMPDLSRRPVLDPSVPFACHTTAGEAVDLEVKGATRASAGFLPADPDLAGQVLLDFRAFDAWYEEDAVNVAHPKDPFKRIDVLPSSRHVRVELDGVLLAESDRPRILFETHLPPRYYLPREDVRVELRPSSTTTWCAYKGQASYLSPVIGDGPVADLAWTYLEPQHDAVPVQGLVAFFDERVDVEIDGVRKERPVTPWSPRPEE